MHAKIPILLWNHLAERLLSREPPGRNFSHDAALLTLLFAATSDGDFDLYTVANLMTESGWRVNQELVRYHDVVFQGSWQTVLLWYIAPKDQCLWFNETLSPAETALARATLLGMKPASSK